jgi:hypothetical protein
MYQSCMFCSTPLGANQSIESFPVGRSLAFDGGKGRLWVVCPACARWNLTPLEERWEAVEEAEKLFREARLRVQSENIGLARLADGTRLIRVGDALHGELAAWRYGGQLLRRRRRYLAVAGVAGAGVLAFGGLAAAGVLGGLGSGWYFWYFVWDQRRNRKVVHRVPAAEAPNGRDVLIRRWHVHGSHLGEEGGDVALYVPDVERKDPKTDAWGHRKYSSTEFVLRGAAARSALGRAMVQVNHRGATKTDVEEAIRVLGGAGDAEAYLRRLARERGSIGDRTDMKDRALTRPGALALEMALHEESERRALAGELALLRAAWREAEEIAGIADGLLDDPLLRLRRSLGRG